MEAADKAKVKKEKEDLNEEYQARAWGRQNNHWDRGSSFSHANGQDRYSPGGLPSPRVKTEPTDEDSGLFQTPVISNRGLQTQAGFPTRKGGTQTPGLSHPPIRRPPAPTTPRRKCIDLILTSPSSRTCTRPPATHICEYISFVIVRSKDISFIANS